MSVANVEDRKNLFCDWFLTIKNKYNIRSDKKKYTWLDSQRIAYLCANEIAKLFTLELAHDAEIEFLNWAYKKKICCDLIHDVEINKKGKKKATPYTNFNNKFFSEVSFSSYTDILDEVMFGQREPITHRQACTTL